MGLHLAGDWLIVVHRAIGLAEGSRYTGALGSYQRHEIQLGQRRFRLDKKENFLTVRVVKHWHRLPSGVDAP